MAPDGDSRGHGADRDGVRWDLLLQVVGAGAAIAAWIAVVGGARVWAKMYAADIPATQTLSVLPERLLLVEGLQALLAPLLVGGGVALVVYFSRARTEKERAKETQETRSEKTATVDAKAHDQRQLSLGESLRAFAFGTEPVKAVRCLRERYSLGALAGVTFLVGFGLLALLLAIVRVNLIWVAGGVALGAGLAIVLLIWVKLVPLAIAAALVLPLAGVAVALYSVVELHYLLAMAAVTVALVWLALGALVDRRAAGVAWTLFAALALWSGAIGFLRLAGAQPDDAERAFETATVRLADGRSVDGLYLGGSGGDVYVATMQRPRTVVRVREEDAVSVEVLAADEAAPRERAEGTPEDAPPPPRAGAEPEVLGEAAATVEGVPLLLEIVGRHEGEDLLTLNLRLTNRLDPRRERRSFTIGAIFDDGVADGRGNTRDSLDGLWLTDLGNSRKYPTARDEDGLCVCSQGLSGIAVGAGESELVSATFGRPEDGGSLVLHLPRHFGDLKIEPGDDA